MPPVDVECVIVGAGVIGLAIARALVLQRREVLILDAMERIVAESGLQRASMAAGGKAAERGQAGAVVEPAAGGTAGPGNRGGNPLYRIHAPRCR